MSEGNSGNLDPQLVELLQSLKNAGAPELQTLSPPDARAAYLKGVQLLSGQAPDIARTVNKRFDASDGPIAIRLYYPEYEPQSSLPLVVYFHGGGWSFGSIETHDNVCRTLCAGAACIVASVDYRLAPEHKFPMAVEDAIAASLWAYDNASVLGADPARIVLAGDSAGANLAAVASLAARDRGYPDLLGQLLIYPATDMAMSHPSHKVFGDGYRLTRPLMVWSSTNYLRDGPDIMDPRASPLRAKDHSGLPPAIIVTAGFDPLRDEAAAYAAKLRNAGVEVQYRCFDNLIHGFINLTGVVDAAARALEEITVMVKNTLGANIAANKRCRRDTN